MKGTDMDKRIAVIGMSLCFPSAENKESFHICLSEGREAQPSEDMIKRRGELTGISDYKSYLKNTRTIHGIELFDHKLYGIFKREALEMPPEMRITMDHIFRLFQDAGYSSERIKKTVCGAVTTQSSIRYDVLQRKPSFLSFFNGMSAMTDGYLSHYFDMRGPVVNVDSTCSSSLLAVIQACDMLLMGRADIMVAGGVQLFLPTDKRESDDMFSKTMGLSSESCLPFDKSASGFFSGEGAGFVLLKRYEEAAKDRDHIYGVILGSGMSSNGDRCSTVYAPCGEAQTESLRRAFTESGVSADDITEVEAHGAATAQGDKAEIESLKAVLNDRKTDEPVLLTSVKSNFGHTVHTAGIAGLLKVLSGFEHDMIYPISGFKEPNPALDFESAHLKPFSETVYTKKGKVRTALIGSYGLNELNIHMIVQNYRNMRTVSEEIDAKNRVLCLTASDEERLRVFCERVHTDIESSPYNINDIIYTLNSGRNIYPYMAVFKFNTKEELLKGLTSPEIIKSDLSKTDFIPERLYEGERYYRVPTAYYPMRPVINWPVKESEKDNFV